MISTDSEQFLL